MRHQHNGHPEVPERSEGLETVILRRSSEARASKDPEGHAVRPSRLGAMGCPVARRSPRIKSGAGSQDDEMREP